MKLSSFLDAGIVIPLFGLIAVNLSLIASTTPSLFIQQLFFFLLGLSLYVFFTTIDYSLYPKFMWFFYTACILLLIVSFAGPQIRGSYRWIDIGGFNLQPSELIKPFVIIFFSSIIARQKINNIYTHFIRLGLLLPITILIFKQPDLGNVLVYLSLFIALEITGGLSVLYILAGAIVFIAIGPFLWTILKDYQRMRILSFINPHMDPIGAGYNALQAVIAIGSGGLFGLGLGRGTQSHLLFLPEYHTDFVFASLGEELGLIGGALVIIFYFLLLLRILFIAGRTEDNLGRLLCVGVFAQLFAQVFINIGMNLSLLPITGITLPLLSYGGSSAVSTCIELGLVASIANISRSKSPIVIR